MDGIFGRFGRLAGTVGLAAGLALGAGWAGTATAQPGPVTPIELDRGEAVQDLGAWAAPNGDQIVSYKIRREAGVQPAGTRIRPALEDFGPFGELTRESLEPPRITFDPAGRTFLVMGRSNNPARMALREPGARSFGATTPITGCDRFTDAAYSPLGVLALACSARFGSNPPDTFGYTRRVGIGGIFNLVTTFTPVFDSFIQPRVTFGTDGTMALAARRWQTTVTPPPINQTREIRVVVRAPDNLTGANLAVTTAPSSTEQIELNGVAVLPDGTVAAAVNRYPTSGASSGWLYLLPPPWTSPEAIDLGWHDARDLAVDSAGNLHILVVEHPDSMAPHVAAASIVKPPAGPPGAPVPVPLNDEFAQGMEVAPDGTEYVITREYPKGPSIRVRTPGGASFGSRIAVTDSENVISLNTALTSEGDLLAAWSEEPGPDDARVMVGGLDSGAPPELTEVEIPGRTLVGAPASFHAHATDSMGIGSYSWDFGDGGTATGPSPRHTYTRPGRYLVTVTAIDRGGHEVSQTANLMAQRGTPLPPALGLNVPKRIRFNQFRQRGLPVRVQADAPVRLRITVGILRGKRAKGLANRAVNRLRLAHNVRIKPNKRKLGKRRNLRLRVQVTATTADGGRRVVTRNLRVRR